MISIRTKSIPENGNYVLTVFVIFFKASNFCRACLAVFNG